MLGTSGHRVNGSDNRDSLHKSSSKRSKYISKSTIAFEIKVWKFLGNNIAVQGLQITQNSEKKGVKKNCITETENAKSTSDENKIIPTK